METRRLLAVSACDAASTDHFTAANGFAAYGLVATYGPQLPTSSALVFGGSLITSTFATSQQPPIDTVDPLPTPTDSRFADLSFDVQSIAWDGEPAFVAAGQWIVAFNDATDDVFASNAPRSFVAASHPIEFLRPLNKNSHSPLWLIQTDPFLRSDDVVRAIGYDRVKYVEPNFIVTAAETTPNDPQLDQLWGIANNGQTGGTIGADVSAELAWDITTGSHDVVIASFDTGIDYNHEDLADNVWRNPGEVPNNGIDDDGNGFVDDVFGIDVYFGDTDPFDGDGHGTHTSGTLGAIGNNGLGTAGVAWNIQIMPIKFLSDAGLGSNDKAIEALNYMIMMKRDFGVNIVAGNHSWYGGKASQALRDTIAESIDLGITFVAAAGNDSRNNDIHPEYPASYPLDGIISVAATDHHDELADFSHFGRTSVDLAAPGDKIFSTLPGNEYGLLSGTSMSTPHVTGTVALLKSLFPGASPAHIKSAILAGVDPIASLAGKTVSGGRLNVAAAIEKMGFFVNVSTPDENALLFDRPTTFQLQMSHDAVMSDVSADDFTINGVVADGVEVLSDKSLRFSFATSPVLVDGLQTMTFSAGAVLRTADGLPNDSFQAKFRYDSLPLSVISTTPITGSIVQTPWSILEVSFNESIDPHSVDVSDLWISNGQVIDAQAIDADTVRFQMTSFIDEQPNFEFQVYQGSIDDAFGNPLVSGFSGQLELDYGIVEFPAEWRPIEPQATLAAERSIHGTISTPHDSDTFVVSLKASQRLSVVADQTDSLRTAVDWLSPSGALLGTIQAATQGKSTWGSWPVVSDGDYQLRVRSASAASTGNYRLITQINAAREMESVLDSANGTLLTAEPVSQFEIVRGSSRQAVILGDVHDGDQDLYRIVKSGNETLSIHVDTSFLDSIHVELLDAIGVRLALGGSNGKHAQTIDEFTGPAGTYFIRVSGQREYTLVTMRGASFDNGRNFLDTMAQVVNVDKVVHGYLTSEPLGTGSNAAPQQAVGTPVSVSALFDEVWRANRPAYDQVMSAAVGDILQQGGHYLVMFDPNMPFDEAVSRLSAASVVVRRELALFHAAAITIDPHVVNSTVSDIMESAWIRHIEPDGAVVGQGTLPNDPRFVEQWGLESGQLNDELTDTDIDATQAWDLLKGSATAGATPVIVAILDTGLDLTHPDLQSNIWRNPTEIPGNGIDDDNNHTIDDVFGYDFVNHDAMPDDDSGHGTHLAGIVGAVTDNASGIAGVASNVRLMPIKVLDAVRQGTLSDVIAGFQYLFFTSLTHGLRVAAALTSWTTTEPSDMLQSVIDTMHRLGTLVVAPSGNDGADRGLVPRYPASYVGDSLLTVGATGRDGRLADFSAFGETVSLAAPGVDILSTLPGGEYGYMSGTSAAAAYVAGTVAVLAAADPTASPSEIETAILNSVDRTIALESQTATGGRLNLADALQSLGDQGDYFQVSLAAAQPVVILANPTGFDLGTFDNALVIGVELFDSKGVLLQSDVGNSVGAEARLEFVAPTSGTYLLRVFAHHNEGAYSLSIDGVRVGRPLSVIATSPSSGQVLREPVDAVQLHFNNDILVSSLDSASFTIDGTAVSATVTDANTIILKTPIAILPGSHTVRLASGTLTDLQGNANELFEFQFAIVVNNVIEGDFDLDEILGCHDLELLQQSIQAGNADTVTYDLNDDGAVNNGDILWWIVVDKQTLPGDANLDGVVDGSDWNIWNDHRFTTNQYWCTGDFTGDGGVDVSDWNIWHDRRFSSAFAPADSQADAPAQTRRLPSAPISNHATPPNRVFPAHVDLPSRRRSPMSQRRHRDSTSSHNTSANNANRDRIFAELNDSPDNRRTGTASGP